MSETQTQAHQTSSQDFDCIQLSKHNQRDATNDSSTNMSILTSQEINTLSSIIPLNIIKPASLSDQRNSIIQALPEHGSSISELPPIISHCTSIPIEASSPRPDKLLMKFARLRSMNQDSPLSSNSPNGGKFNDDFYSGVDDFLNNQGVEFIYPDNYTKTSNETIKLKIVETTGSETSCIDVKPLSYFRPQSASSLVSINVTGSKLLQRRGSVSQMPVVKPCIRLTSSDDNFASEKSLKNVKQLHQLAGCNGDKKMDSDVPKKLKTLLTISSCDLDSLILESETIIKLSEHSASSVYKSSMVIESLADVISPKFSGRGKSKMLFEAESVHIIPNYKHSLSNIVESPVKKQFSVQDFNTRSQSKQF